MNGGFTHAAIRVRGARQHHLKSLDFEIPHGKLTVVTGPSGSGKSSLAFHTLYAEGMRRYVETFSPYVRQFFERMDKPDVDLIEGIPPAIAVEQKNRIRSSRSTVGTLTELNDSLRMLFAYYARGYDPETGEEIVADTVDSAVAWISHENESESAVLVAFAVAGMGEVGDWWRGLNEQGFLRVIGREKLWRTDEDAPEEASSGEWWVVQDRVKVGDEVRLREAIEAGFGWGKGKVAVFGADELGAAQRVFSDAWENPNTGFSLRAPSPSLFSFNHPQGACETCRGFGRVIGLSLEKAVPDGGLSLEQGAIRPFVGESGDVCARDLERHCRERGIPLDVPWEELPEKTRDWIFHGERRRAGLSAWEATDELWSADRWYGVVGYFDWLETKTYKMQVRVFLSKYRSYTTCLSCRGARLQSQALCFQVAGQTLPSLWAMSVRDLLGWFEVNMPAEDLPISLKQVREEMAARLRYLSDVGLGYLSLDRPARTLSGGEIERVNLTTCLGSSLTGALFVLDEPTVGLHARDVERLVKVLHQLRDQGNTVVVVEHEERVMHAADELLDIGPGSGKFGGEILFQGAVHSAPAKTGGTLPWLRGERVLTMPKKRRKIGREKIEIRDATQHNLRKLSVNFPLGVFGCLTGISGSGKSTLAHDVLYAHAANFFGKPIESEAARVKSIRGFEHVSGVELIDQSPVSRTPRSTPAVFLGAFDAIRQLFATTPEALLREYTPGFFSFNSGEGRCDRCSGAGAEKVEMQFLSDVFVTCPACSGTRYKASLLDVKYQGKSISDVLAMSVAEAREFFATEEKTLTVAQKKRHNQIDVLLEPLSRVGLGYLSLGQPLNTLSGGEAQRLKLCQLLAASGEKQGGQLLILDEPTTGLHMSDIENLLEVFQDLVRAGHSLWVIEHQLDVVRAADWVIDLGPEAGVDGGQLVGEGTPEQIAKLPTETGRYLAAAMGNSHEPATTSAREDAQSREPNPAQHSIVLHGARHHNLKNLALEIPREKLIVISGLSGSGKSTLAFDVLFAEGQRRFLHSMSAYARQFSEQLEKPEVDFLAGLPPTVAIEQRVSQGSSKSTVATTTELWNFIRLLYAKLGTTMCPSCAVAVQPQAMAELEKTLREMLVDSDVKLLAPVLRGRKGFHTDVAAWAHKQGFRELWVDGEFVESENFAPLARFKEHDIDVVVAEIARCDVKALAAALKLALDHGKGVVRVASGENSRDLRLLSTQASCPKCQTSFAPLDPRLFSFQSPYGWCHECRGHGRVPRAKIAVDASKFDSILAEELHQDRTFQRMEQEEFRECEACRGSRLNPHASHVTLGNQAIHQLASMEIAQAMAWLKQLEFLDNREKMIARDIVPEIEQRLHFLEDVGLGYLQLSRSAQTLSGGESQRIRLAAQLGSHLQGVLYVLDEPTIGLHPRDNQALLKTLVALRERGNSLIVVEHDEDTIAQADQVIDLGPAAGRFGGQVVYQGKPPQPGDEISLSDDERAARELSPTWRAFIQPMAHPSRGAYRPIPKKHVFFEMKGCTAHNLKKITFRVPQQRLTVLTGVSGAGKSTLLHQCLAAAARGQHNPAHFSSWKNFEAIENVYEIDQSPIGKTSRSCPATYLKIFDAIRALFAQVPEARVRGYEPSRFSFNTGNGVCDTCSGNGRVKLEMDFLPTSWVPCETCRGKRYNSATLEIHYRGKSIGDILAMTLSDAAEFFAQQPKIALPLQLLAETGLGYLQLGQASPTLSGGEAQRLKLISEISRGRSLSAKARNAAFSKHNLYLIEEPTVGLHLEDVKKLIEVLHRLTDEGHTVVVIEHHMAVAAEADWVIDVGPEAGAAGGEILAQGPPPEVAKCKNSHTAEFLKQQLFLDN